jgi:aspartate kinase
VPTARKIGRISYEEMLEMAASGTQVLQLRSVEYARRNGVRIHVRSSFDDSDGTWVADEDGAEEGESVEQAMISGVALDTGEAKITLLDVPDQPGVAATIFRAVAAEGVHVDMIVQNVGHDGQTDLSFTVPRDDLPRLTPVLDRVVKEIGAPEYTTDDGIAKVSLVGAGMRSNPGVVAEMFEALAEKGINIEMISTSSIRVSCIVRRRDAEEAVRTIHDRFDVGAAAEPSSDAGDGA